MLRSMAQSPTLEGLRVAFDRPSVTLAEITWRWAFGAAACFLLTLSFFEYLHSLGVSALDMLFLRSGQPWLISQALAHIGKGSARRLLDAMLIVLPALAMVWIISASLSRAAVLKCLLEYFSRGKPADSHTPFGLRFWRTPEESWRLRSLVGLNFLRALLALAAVVGVLGAAILAGLVAGRASPRPGLVLLVFVLLALLVIVLWLWVNWFLSLAPLFVVRDGQNTFDALSAVVQFCCQRAAQVFWSSGVFSLLHFVVFVLAGSVVLLPLALVTVVPPGFVMLAIVLITLVYWAIVDFFYVGRLAAYVAILETPENNGSICEDGIDSGQPSTIRIEPVAGLPPSAASLQPHLPPIPPSEDDILSDI